MRKSLLIVTAIIATVLLCSFVLSACISTSMKSVEKKLEKKGYTVYSVDYQKKDPNANYYDETIDWQISTSPNSGSGILGKISDALSGVTIICYNSSSVAKTEYENSSYTEFKKAGDDDYCKYRNGRVVAWGLKSTIEDIK